MSTPKSLQSLTAYQTSYQAQLKVLPYYHIVRPIVEEFLKQIISYGAFYIRVKIDDLDAILQSKRLKSMMETGNGATLGGKETRAEVTKQLFGCDVKKLLLSEYPKYGFLSQPNAVRDLVVNAGMWMQYGDVSIQLKKERMVHRTTLCVGNSVNFGRYQTLIPTRVDDVKATCICGLPHDGNPNIQLPDPLMFYGVFANWVVKGKLTIENFPAIDDLVEDIPSVFEFFELQYHGEIDITKDVERIDIIPTSEEEKMKMLAFKEKFAEIGVRMEVEEF